MPLRSSGCYTCRKRKIRCDETRPACQRCATHGVPCPGYRTDVKGGVEFKDQTLDTVQKAVGFYRGKEGRGPVLKAFDRETLGRMVSGTDSGPDSTSGLGFTVFTKNSSPDILLSPAINRAQLYSQIVDIYLPKKESLGVEMDHYNFYELIAAKATNQPALLDALDAMGLITVGSLHKDRHILNQSISAYGRAMASLVKAFAKPENAYDDDLLAAVTVLGSCALYDEIGQHDIAWGKHIKGSQQLIAARGTKSLQSTLSLLLFSNTRHGALVWALVERKAPYMALPEWREVAFRAPIQDTSTLFYDAAIQIPGILERFDQLGASLPLSIHNVDAILADANEIERSMRSWFLDWDVDLALSGGSIYEERPIEEFATFASLVSDRTFTTAYRFQNFPMAYMASLYWMTMHYLRATIQSLHNLRHALASDWYPDPEQAVTEDELFDYAIHLCKFMPFACEPCSSSTGHVGIFLPMRTAAIQFTQHGKWQYAKWIGNVRMNVFTRGLSPPMIGDKPGALKRLDQILLRQSEKQFPWKSGRDSQPGRPVEWKADEVCNDEPPKWSKPVTENFRGVGGFPAPAQW